MRHAHARPQAAAHERASSEPPTLRPARCARRHRWPGTSRGRDLAVTAVRLGRHADDRAAGGAGALLAAFLVIESRAEIPILPLSIFRLRTLDRREHGRAAVRRQLLRVPVRRHPVHAAGAALQRAADRGWRGWLRSVTSIAARRPSRSGWSPGSGQGRDRDRRMTLIGAGSSGRPRSPFTRHFLANLAGPFVVAGAGTAFSFIPISIAALAGRAPTSGWARLGADEHLHAARRRDRDRDRLERRREPHATRCFARATPAPAALTGGFHQAFWVLGAIALIALPAIFALVRRSEPGRAAASNPRSVTPEPALAGNQLTRTTN